ncbi:MAG: hypothetical protein P0S95_00225 [Rhabdochlamydiaceae bacterium]|nr:hypothetical protein [Candidatus Amphrikana amoebophyrae]
MASWARDDSSIIKTAVKLGCASATTLSCVVYLGVIIIKKLNIKITKPIIAAIVPCAIFLAVTLFKRLAKEIDRQHEDECKIIRYISHQRYIIKVFKNMLQGYRCLDTIPLVSMKDKISFPIFMEGDQPVKIIELKSKDSLPIYLLAIKTFKPGNPQHTVEYTFRSTINGFKLVVKESLKQFVGECNLSETELLTEFGPVIRNESSEAKLLFPL